MELRDLEYFGVIAEHANMRRAAQALGVTPPALSKSVRRLEATLEARLLRRTGRGVELTPFGVALADQARRLRRTLADITREASDLTRGRAGHLRIGAGPTDCELLPAACTRLLDDAPGLSLDITVSDNDELVSLVREGKLDIVLNALPEAPPAEIEQLLILEDSFVAYCSAQHPLARRRKITLEDLRDERWTTSVDSYRPREMLVRCFLEHGLPEPRFAVQTRSLRLRLQIVAASRLLGFGPAMAARMAASRYQLKILPLPELTLRRPVGVMYRKGGYLPPTATRLIRLLQRVRAKSE